MLTIEERRVIRRLAEVARTRKLRWQLLQPQPGVWAAKVSTNSKPSPMREVEVTLLQPQPGVWVAKVTARTNSKPSPMREVEVEVTAPTRSLACAQLHRAVITYWPRSPGAPKGNRNRLGKSAALQLAREQAQARGVSP